MPKRTMQTRSMKRSEEESKGQVEGVKRSKTEDSGPEFNPFLVEPVLVKLLKLVDEVSQLKELRKMCQTWDEFNLKEIEERAFNGKVEAIDFQWTDDTITKSEAETKFVQFLGDTSSIPRLFSSFKFNFPGSWTILSKHMEFFSIYQMTFLDLAIPMNFTQEEQICGLLTKFMETELWGNLKEITISVLNEDKIELPSSSLFVPSSGPIQRKLQKLNLKEDISREIIRMFKTDFDFGKYTKLTSLKYGYLPGGNLDFSNTSFDASKITSLEIGEVESGSPSAREFTSGLIKLARNGMTLKNFDMTIKVITNMDEYSFVENLSLSCSNLTQFLASQSSTLERLSFNFICLQGPEVPEGADIWCKVHLPKFEALHTLKLWVDFKLVETTNPRRMHKKLFGMTNKLSVHFPKLVNLTLTRESSLIALKVNPAPDEAGQLHLERLEICNSGFGIWSTSFLGVIGSVKELKCTANLFYGEILPWAQSLRSLYIQDLNVEVEREIFKLNHFKKLEEITTKYFQIIGRQIHAGYHTKLGAWDVEKYLNTFKEATELPLTSITFRGPQMEEKLKKEFIKYFPFPVKFQIHIDPEDEEFCGELFVIRIYNLN